MRSHFLHLLLYSTLVSIFFAVLARRRPAEQARLGGIIWLVLVGGTLVLAYLMVPFPS